MPRAEARRSTRSTLSVRRIGGQKTAPRCSELPHPLHSSLGGNEAGLRDRKTVKVVLLAVTVLTKHLAERKLHTGATIRTDRLRDHNQTLHGSDARPIIPVRCTQKHFSTKPQCVWTIDC